MDNRVWEMQVFVRVIETGSFSEAARQLLMSPSTVSKLIGRMEDRLGVRLVERSTRRLSLTDEGRLLHERGTALLSDLHDIEQEVSQGGDITGGTVRVNASVAFGVLGVEPFLPEFWRRYPNIIVDMSLSDEIVDLYLDRTDVAFRVGPLTDSSLTSRKVGTARRMIVAAPGYLEQHGVPEKIEDLDHHNCLGFNFRRAAPIWPLRDGGRIVDRLISGSLLANNGETVRRMAVAGAGLARLGDYHVRDDVEAGRLTEVLADAGHGDVEDIHALYLGGTRMPYRIRVFLDFMMPKLQEFMKRR
ncbi:LysR family transcriptional regulator [Komagataeibacter nataicola]|uniref:LysR family transcriptional regulator n=1 Tax=Komagataeibacter nataicola TaxID=265960 RepID=A0A9N7C6Q9_9PROT|nr:LysR family transcriptional regulator [Komagataeibacter nataicola]AQU87073.1 LysR family transcriptional regulator [Komagataeibacter nataicola]PYD66157.1 LysR family transcriptional regulator [Komagataeibacter nataicola]GBR25597.1 transcriptional regulator [Komagataeibacter nataicola NRIC 0616]